MAPFGSVGRARQIAGPSPRFKGAPLVSEGSGKVLRRDGPLPTVKIAPNEQRRVATALPPMTDVRALTTALFGHRSPTRTPASPGAIGHHAQSMRPRGEQRLQ
jgi:hypothetical protein